MYGLGVSQDHVSTDSKSPPFQQVADRLRADIVDGRLSVGDQLATQHELRDRFGVSRATIQRALQELKNGGYIDSHQGQGTFVADWRDGVRVSGNGAGYHPDHALFTLPDALDRAFAARSVTIDVFCFTAESLNMALTSPLARIRSGGNRPEDITLRLLIPSLDAHLALPSGVADPTDPRPLERLRRIAESSAFGVINALRSLEIEGLVPTVSAEVREVPITPVFKSYLLNGREALQGFYAVVPATIPLPSPAGGAEDIEVWDIRGLSATLFRHVVTEPEAQGTMFVQQAQAWFDSLWSTIAGESAAVGD